MGQSSNSQNGTNQNENRNFQEGNFCENKTSPFCIYHALGFSLTILYRGGEVGTHDFLKRDFAISIYYSTKIVAVIFGF